VAVESNPLQLLGKAVQALQRGNMPAAAGIARELVAQKAFDHDDSRRMQLADLCMHCELYSDAREIYASFEEKHANDVSFRYKSGTAAYKSKQLKEAALHFSKCVQLRPGHPASYLQLGHILKAQRKFSDAAQHYLDYVKRSGEDKGHGYWSLADLRDFEFTDSLIEEMRTHLERCASNSEESSIMHFALGIAAEQQQNFDDARQHFDSANAIQSTLRPFRDSAYHGLLDSIAAADLSAVDVVDAEVRPLFIVGLPRSGTTLVEQILAAHSKVVATDELPFIERIGFELERSGGYGQRLAALTDAEKQQYRERYLQEAGQLITQKDCHFVDKNPNNFMHIGLIRTLFPESLIVNLRRDLRDNAISMYRQLFSVGHDYSSSFEGLYSYASGYLKIMQHWIAVFPSAIRVQSYEDLVTNPDEQIAALLEFCRLESEPQCFEFYKNKQLVMTPSASQVSRPMYTTSIDRWKVYKDAFASEFDKLDQLQLNQ
jgi:tetratricopeptide (TPR) repeat protein